jgi:hypothetical protein
MPPTRVLRVAVPFLGFRLHAMFATHGTPTALAVRICFLCLAARITVQLRTRPPDAYCRRLLRPIAQSTIQ